MSDGVTKTSDGVTKASDGVARVSDEVTKASDGGNQNQHNIKRENNIGKGF